MSIQAAPEPEDKPPTETQLQKLRAEERELEELLFQQNREAFIFGVVSEGLHPEKSAEKCGIPMSVIQHWRKQDAGIEACFVGVEKRRGLAIKRYKDHRKAVSADELLNNQVKMAHRMLFEAGFEETFLRFVRTLDVETEEGRKEFLMFMKSGPLRDLFMRMGAAKIQMVEQEKPMDGKSEVELEATIEDLQKELREMEELAASNQAIDVEVEYGPGSEQAEGTEEEDRRSYEGPAPEEE